MERQKGEVDVVNKLKAGRVIALKLLLIFFSLGIHLKAKLDFRTSCSSSKLPEVPP